MKERNNIGGGFFSSHFHYGGIKTGNFSVKGFSLFSFGGWLGSLMMMLLAGWLNVCCIWNISFSKDFFYCRRVGDYRYILWTATRITSSRFHYSKEIIKFSASLRIREYVTRMFFCISSKGRFIESRWWNSLGCKIRDCELCSSWYILVIGYFEGLTISINLFTFYGCCDHGNILYVIWM